MSPADSPPPKGAYAGLRCIASEAPAFMTDDFAVLRLSPSEAGDAVQALLQRGPVTSGLSWLQEGQPLDARASAALLERHCVAGTAQVWGVHERTCGMGVGLLIARPGWRDVELELVCISRHWAHRMSSEIARSVLAWAREHSGFDVVRLH